MKYQTAIQTTMLGQTENIIWVQSPTSAVKKYLSPYFHGKVKNFFEYHFLSEDALMTAIEFLKKNGAKPSPNQSQRFIEFTINDFRDQASSLTKKYRAERDVVAGVEPNLIRFEKVVFSTQTVVWKTPATFGIASIAHHQTGKLKTGSEYTMKIRMPELFEWIKSYQQDDPFAFPDPPEFYEVIGVQDVKLSCNCAAFHWQGMKYKLSQLDSTTVKIKIPDPVWGPRHNDNNGLCKHLLGLINGWDDWKSALYEIIRNKYTV